jgi:hypothetical protein
MMRGGWGDSRKMSADVRRYEGGAFDDDVLGGIEYVPTAWATISWLSCEYKATSPTINVRPTFISWHTPTMGLPAAGFRKKLIVKLVVTAKGTMPMVPRIAT